MTSDHLLPQGTRLLGGLLLGALLLVGCIQSPTYPTPDSNDEPADQPDGGGSSAFVLPVGLSFPA